MNAVVVKLGGRGVDAAVSREPIIDAIARLAAHERLVIVHGGGAAIDARLDRLGIEIRRVQGLRVTDEATMDAHFALVIQGGGVQPVCHVDFDRDGKLTIFDFIAFQDAFTRGDPPADFDGDGELTVFDYLLFQSRFIIGCGD